MPASSLARARAPFWSSHLGALFPSLVTAGIWDREYAKGKWDHLSSGDELARYLILMGRVVGFGGSCRVLDVGCGAGRLLELLRSVAFERYVGIDLSSEAVERARSLEVPGSSFHVADATEFGSEESFDLIVFNEILYYLPDPAAVLRRYAAMLSAGGVLAVSMFDCLPARLAWWRLRDHFDVMDRVRVENRRGLSWSVRYLAPR